MIGQNELSLSIGDNPDVAKLFADATPGKEVCVGTIHGVVSEKTGDRVTLAVTKIEPEEDDSEEKDPESEDGEDPKGGSRVQVMGAESGENVLLAAPQD